MQDYSTYYATLGVTPNTDWGTLRARYRRLMRRWHPDRYSADATEKRVAEERTKRITFAYQALERYHRDHGVLPPVRRQTAVAETSLTPDVASPSERADSVFGTDGTETSISSEGTARSTPGRWQQRMAIVLVAVGTVMFFAFDPVSELKRVESPPPEGAREADTAPAASETEITRGSGGIRVGSTLGDVYAIQGIPTSTQGDSWYYGKSEIRFAQGKVVSWEESLDNPLRIDRDQAILRREGFFGVGSTKEEVRAVQGPPTTETDTVWYYAPSMVFFENDRVVRWKESPIRPLRVAQ